MLHGLLSGVTAYGDSPCTSFHVREQTLGQNIKLLYVINNSMSFEHYTNQAGEGYHLIEKSIPESVYLNLFDSSTPPLKLNPYFQTIPSVGRIE